MYRSISKIEDELGVLTVHILYYWIKVVDTLVFYLGIFSVGFLNCIWLTTLAAVMCRFPRLRDE